MRVPGRCLPRPFAHGEAIKAIMPMKKSTPTPAARKFAPGALMVLAFLASGPAAFDAAAGEGMWVPQQLPEIAGPLRQAGLQRPVADLVDLTGDPLGAVVSLGFCTASFVSPQGLVITNHHCAYGHIQLNSTPERNLIRDGFYAPTRADEPSAGPNARVYVLDEIIDVSDRVRQALDRAGDDPLERDQALQAASKRLVAECEADPDYRCELYSFFEGVTHRLFKNLAIRDVRLVYAPPGSVGKFGGEEDNWMWPRHTGDFSFIRAYVGRDGKPAAYSPDNVPYRPKRWLRFADAPLAEGDFVMVAGYPRRTNRYALAVELANTIDWAYPARIRHNTGQVDLVEAAARQDADIAVKYASHLFQWHNGLKNNRGQLEGFARSGALASKQVTEREFLAWLASRGARGEPALEAHRKLEALATQAQRTQVRDALLDGLNGTGAIGAALRLYRLAIERDKPDAQRALGYQERDLSGIEATMREMENRYAAKMDRQLQEYWLDQYVRLPAAQRLPALDAWLGGEGAGADASAVQPALDRLAATRLGDTGERLRWLAQPRAAFERSDDPALRYAVALMPALLELEREAAVRAGETSRWNPLYLQAFIDYKQARGEPVYPDANGSLRITFGNVMGYSPRDGVRYTPFTTLEGLLAKDTGDDPFDSPQALLDAVRERRHGGLFDPRIGSVPVNFMADLDISGGNSGSPALDAQGRLVGLVFDMNWESVSSNWVFDPAMTRTIVVDSRFVQWIMREVAPAPALLEELELRKAGS